MENDMYIPLSLISQLGYCKRRAALIINECQWNDSADTVKGRIEHQNVHTPKSESRQQIRKLTELYVYSKKLGIHGYCDCVEVIEDENGSVIPGLHNKKVTIYPIEYKHGKLRNEEGYNMQLCAQAICMEEMFDCNIKEGAIFYINSHRRDTIQLDDALRNKVFAAVDELKLITETGKVPAPIKSKKCIKCSLKDICMPETESSSEIYMKSILKTFKGDIT